LLELYVRRDCRREALDLVSSLPSDTPHREALKSAVRGACLAAMQNWIPALAYLQIARGSGCRDPICFRGLVTAYLATRDLAAAERTLREWQQAHGTNGEIMRFTRELAQLRSASDPEQGMANALPASDRARNRDLRVDSAERPAAALAHDSAARPATRPDVTTGRR
jgi:hypothetical protein